MIGTHVGVRDAHKVEVPIWWWCLYKLDAHMVEVSIMCTVVCLLVRCHMYGGSAYSSLVL